MKAISNIVSLALIIILNSCGEKKAELHIKNNSIEYNSVIVGKAYDTSFYIYNTGNDTLSIFNHTCTCECTVIDLKDGQQINPKDSFLLKMRLNVDSTSMAKSRQVQCTFKSNSDSIFNRIEIRYMAR